MITKDSLIKASQNFDFYLEQGRYPYLNILAPDPEEIDEDVVIGKLNFNTLELKINGISEKEDLAEDYFARGYRDSYKINDYINDSDEDEDEDEDYIKEMKTELSNEQLLDMILSILISYIENHLEYYNCVLNALENSRKCLKPKVKYKREF